jgi:hypothetical protein
MVFNVISFKTYLKILNYGWDNPLGFAGVLCIVWIAFSKNCSSVNMRIEATTVTLKPITTLKVDKCPRMPDQMRSRAKAYIGCRIY